MTLSHNLPLNNYWGSHYLLVNYDIESLFRGVKILRDTPTKISEIPPAIGCFYRSLLIYKISNMLFWITLGMSDHIHFPLIPYHMPKTNFITQLILEIMMIQHFCCYFENVVTLIFVIAPTSNNQLITVAFIDL